MDGDDTSILGDLGGSDHLPCDVCALLHRYGLQLHFRSLGDEPSSNDDDDDDDDDDVGDDNDNDNDVRDDDDDVRPLLHRYGLQLNL